MPSSRRKSYVAAPYVRRLVGRRLSRLSFSRGSRGSSVRCLDRRHHASITDAAGQPIQPQPRRFRSIDDQKRQELTVFSNALQPITAVAPWTPARMAHDARLARDAAEQFVLRMLPDDRARVGSFSDRTISAENSRTIAMFARSRRGGTCTSAARRDLTPWTRPWRRSRACRDAAWRALHRRRTPRATHARAFSRAKMRQLMVYAVQESARGRRRVPELGPSWCARRGAAIRRHGCRTLAARPAARTFSSADTTT